MKINASVIVFLGAVSYGIPASLFKMASNNGALPANLLLSQVFCAALILICLNFARKNSRLFKLNNIQRGKLLLSGLAMASTNTLYFASLQFISVTVSAVLLMQSVWITMILGFIFKRHIPSKNQIIAVIFIMIGTVLATQIFTADMTLSVIGVMLAFGSACAYACMMMITNSVVKDADPIQRAMYVSVGAVFFLILFLGSQIEFNDQLIVFRWAPVIAIFSVVFPLICFSKGMPQLSPGLGGILSSVELPSAIIFAYILLNEEITSVQISGILIILLSVIYPNLAYIIRKKR
ncbi:EamA family transporter [Morganella psychrotolerans]|uniref:EamA family transporter n=1 Tax=Morganella psychrotolerans TaxID=368603 RepID=UPI0039AEAC0F